MPPFLFGGFMITISLSFTDEQAQRLAPAVEFQARQLLRNPDVQARLGVLVNSEGGPVTIDDLTHRQRAKLVLYSHLMFLRQQYDRNEARRVHGDAAAEAARDDSPIEVE